MQGLILDTSICIDLAKGGLLAIMGTLSPRPAIPDITFAELVEPSGEEVLAAGIEVVSITANGVSRAAELADSYGGVSTPDIYCLVACEELQRTLATADRALTKTAHAVGVRAHGMLWLLDQLVTEKKLTNDAAAGSLELMLIRGCWQPKGACELKIREWRGGGDGEDQGAGVLE